MTMTRRRPTPPPIYRPLARIGVNKGTITVNNMIFLSTFSVTADCCVYAPANDDGFNLSLYLVPF